MRGLLIGVLMTCVCHLGWANMHYQKEDSLIFMRYMAYAEGLEHAPSLQETACFFLNTPYVAGVLDAFEDEPLVVNLHQLDCVTLVEHAVALTALMRQQTPTWNEYTRILNLLRYRGGQRKGYASRLHYFSEWAQEAEQKGYVEEMTCWWNAQQHKVNFSILTDYADKNQHLRHCPACKQKMQEVEVALSQTYYCYLPKQLISPLLQDGDIIAFCGDGKGIDVWHVGIVVYQQDVPHLLHASSEQGKVVISHAPLKDYMLHKSRYRGYRVFRMKV